MVHSPALVKLLADIVGAENVLSDPADCWSYGYDNSRRHALPDAVAFVTTHPQVRDIALMCNDRRISLVARGRGTGTTGATVPLLGGVVVSFERMDNICSIDPDNRAMIVEPGVTNKAVQDAASAHGFFGHPIPLKKPPI